MKKLLLFGALAFGFNAFGQETIIVESQFDLSELRLYGRYGTEDEVYYINESESSDFQLDYYEMMGERTLMSCSGEGSIKNGELLVKEFDGAFLKRLKSLFDHIDQFLQRLMLMKDIK